MIKPCPPHDPSNLRFSIPIVFPLFSIFYQIQGEWKILTQLTLFLNLFLWYFFINFRSFPNSQKFETDFLNTKRTRNSNELTSLLNLPLLIFFLLIFASIYTSNTTLTRLRNSTFSPVGRNLKQYYVVVGISAMPFKTVYTYSRRRCSLRKFNEDIKL